MGTRLASRLNGLPKPLVNICGKPLLQHQIELLVSQGTKEILMLTSYGADKIQTFCHSKLNFGIKINFISDTFPLGTAGSVIAALPFLDDDFLVLYGDTMLDVDLKRFQAAHFEKGMGATIFLHPNDHPHDSDLVEIDSESRIKAFHPYPRSLNDNCYLPNLVNAALYCIKSSAIFPYAGEKKFADFGRDLFPKMLADGIQLAAYKSPEYIKDCGTPERLDKVTNDYITGKVSASNLRLKQAAVFVDRDGTINEDVDHLSHDSQLRILPGVCEAIKALNHSFYKVVVITNQPVIARGDCTIEGLQKIHNKLETILSKDGAYFDDIRYCPHHPDMGFAGEVASMKVSCQCRKPNTGLVSDAIESMNVCPEQSWMVGDTTTDMLMATRAGLKSVLVQTGKGGLDYKYKVAPDFTFSNLQSAVNFILFDYPKKFLEARSILREMTDVRIIFLGGQSRAGKTNYASIVKYALKSLGIDSLIVSLDGWLKSESDRGPGVEGRYDLQGIANFLSFIKEFEGKIRIPLYNKLNKKIALSDHDYKVSRDSVVIIEGTIALNFVDLIPEELKRSIYLDVDETLRRNRFLREYLLRGLSWEEANSLYKSRLLDEFQLIAETSKNADIRIISTSGEISDH